MNNISFKDPRGLIWNEVTGAIWIPNNEPYAKLHERYASFKIGTCWDGGWSLYEFGYIDMGQALDRMGLPVVFMPLWSLAQRYFTVALENCIDFECKLEWRVFTHE